MRQEGTSYHAVIRSAQTKAGELAAVRPPDAAALVERLIAATPRERRRIYNEHPEAAEPSVVRALLDRASLLRRHDLRGAMRLTRLAL
jgi:hypothetical protein